MKQIALNYLNQNPILHCSMIDVIVRDQAQFIYVHEDGVLIKDFKSEALFISTSTKEKSLELLSLIDSAKLLILHQNYIVDEICAKFNTEVKMICYQAVYCSNELLPQNSDILIEPLSLNYLEQASAQYHSETTYIQNRIEEGAMYGAFINSELCGFIGTHTEGSIGLLEVFEKHRKKGIGYALLTFMINHQLNLGLTPFAQVVTTNKNSLNLQRKCNMQISQEEVYWFF